MRRGRRITGTGRMSQVIRDLQDEVARLQQRSGPGTAVSTGPRGTVRKPIPGFGQSSPGGSGGFTHVWL